METDKILKANRMIEFFVNHHSPITNQQSSLANHQSNGVGELVQASSVTVDHKGLKPVIVLTISLSESVTINRWVKPFSSASLRTSGMTFFRLSFT